MLQKTKDNLLKSAILIVVSVVVSLVVIRLARIIFGSAKQTIPDTQFKLTSESHTYYGNYLQSVGNCAVIGDTATSTKVAVCGTYQVEYLK